jgi:transcriptional regulator with XRE-family HTH domain
MARAWSRVAGDGSTIGRQLRLIRHSRGLSQQVIADLAGISKDHLSRLESGQRALDRRSLIIALANALQVSPTELTEVALPDLAEDSRESAPRSTR